MVEPLLQLKKICKSSPGVKALDSDPGRTHTGHRCAREGGDTQAHHGPRGQRHEHYPHLVRTARGRGAVGPRPGDA